MSEQHFMTIGFWFFVAAICFGMLLMQMSVGAALVAFGSLGITFLFACFILHIRDQP